MLTQRAILSREFPLDATRVPVLWPPADADVDPGDHLLPRNWPTLADMVAQQSVDIDKLRRDLLHAKNSTQSSSDSAKLIKSLLPTLDAFEWVLAAAAKMPADETLANWLKSVESIHSRLIKLLEGFGLVPMRPVGKRVDLNIHEVVEYRPTEDAPNEYVIAERQKGYLLNGALIREAKVIVAFNDRRR